MNDLAQYKEHIGYTFAAFCKVVLRNTSMSAYRDIGRRQKREISLDYLMKEKCYNPVTIDGYFFEQTSSTELIVGGEKIVIENERLAKVFSDLPKLGQEVLILYFFFGYTDKRIGEKYGKSRMTVNYWKIAVLKQLRKEMERLEYEEQENDTFGSSGKSRYRRAGSRKYCRIPLQRILKYLSVFQGCFNADIQDSLEAQLIKAILQFHFDR